MITEQPSRGYVIVATVKKSFLLSAFNLMESIKDFYPEAKITLFTEQEWIDTENYNWDEFDNVFPCASYFRSKMYGIANTPYDQTFYIDADCVIEHEDIKHVFDNLDGHDMVYVELTEVAKHHFADWDWGPGPIDHLTHCGGVVLYDKRNPLVLEFMEDWNKIFPKQDNGDWWPIPEIPKRFNKWDQFTLWYLIHHDPKYKSLKIKYFEDGYRWNYFSSFGFNLDGSYNYGVKDPIVLHYSSWMDKDGNKGFLSNV